MIRSIAIKLNFPIEAVDCLYECYKEMIATDGLLGEIERVKEEIFCGNDRSFSMGLEQIAAKAGVNRYTSDMVVLLMCVPTLKYIYKSRGLGEALLWETMSDLRCKLFECKNVKGVWGNFVAYWYGDFFRLKRFKLGRLEYEKLAFPLDGYKDIFKKGDEMLTCHIPSEGPLLEEEVISSLKRAYDFFPEYRREGVLPVLCHSWLLYPPYRGRVFPETSNIYKFAQMFEIMQVRSDEKYGDLWRVFNIEYSDGILPSLPENTSMQKRLKGFLLDGNQMGDAYGFLLFDGEKIVTGS